MKSLVILLANVLHEAKIRYMSFGFDSNYLQNYYRFIIQMVNMIKLSKFVEYKSLHFFRDANIRYFKLPYHKYSLQKANVIIIYNMQVYNSPCKIQILPEFSYNASGFHYCTTLRL